MNEDRKQLIKYEGERFALYRRKCNKSRRLAARQIGITPRALAAYERGEREPKLDTVIKMSRFYRITFGELTKYKDIHFLENNGFIKPE